VSTRRMDKLVETLAPFRCTTAAQRLASSVMN
jgi:hypothetical protein